jgi:GGDEF domain-containing protein
VLVTGDEVDVIGEQARLLVDAFAQPFAVAGLILTVTASIGAAAQPRGTLHRNDLLRQADIAMYTAKTAGKSCFHISDQQWQPA